MQMANEALRQRIRATEAEVKAYTLSLDRFLARNLSTMLRSLDSESITASEAARLLGRVETVMAQNGLQDEVDKIRATYGREFGYIDRDFSTLGYKDAFSDADLTTVQTLITFDTSNVGEAVSSYLGDVKATMMRSIIAGEQVNYQDLHDDLGGRMVGNLETELNTSLQAFSRTITMSKAEELGYDLYVYLGPDDNITRPFCEHLLAKSPPIYTKQQIDAMNNKQGLAVAQYGGGYNCRHQWRPISAEDAASRGYTK